MSDDRKATQGVPAADDRKKGAADGVNSQAQRGATGGGDDAAPYPNPHTGKSDNDPDFADDALSHGGQSAIGYHGTGRLGKSKTEAKGNPNSATGKDI